MKQSPRNTALSPPSRSDVLSAITSMKESIRPEVSELACLLSVPVFQIRRTPHHDSIQNLPRNQVIALQPLLAQIIRYDCHKCHCTADAPPLRPASAYARLRDREPSVRGGDRGLRRLHHAVERQGSVLVAHAD